MWGRLSERPLYPSIRGFRYVGLENAGPQMEGNKGCSESLPQVRFWPFLSMEVHRGPSGKLCPNFPDHSMWGWSNSSVAQRGILGWLLILLEKV